ARRPRNGPVSALQEPGLPREPLMPRVRHGPREHVAIAHGGVQLGEPAGRRSAPAPGRALHPGQDPRRPVSHRRARRTGRHGRGHARITDFGLAEPQGASDDPDMIVGTPAYLAPECLLEGRAPTVQSDLYSLGLVLYEVFTGRPAFDATTLKEMILLRREAKPTSPSRHQRDIDPVIERLILVCLEKDPGRRPPSALAVAASLPGGDPLAAAIAAGETPSPELVAATRSGA